LLDIYRSLISGSAPARRAWLVLSGTTAGLFFRPRYEHWDDDPGELEHPAGLPAGTEAG
jgi:hypothetical protein